MCLKGYILEDKTTLFYNAKPNSTGFERDSRAREEKGKKIEEHSICVVLCRWQQNISSFECQQISETTLPI